MVKTSKLAMLLRECLDHPDARDVLLDVGGQLGDPLLGLLHRRPGPVSVPVGDQHYERDRGERDRRQSRIEHEHRHRREQDRDDRLGDEDQAVAEKEPHRLQIDRRPRHQLPGLLAIEERELEALQMAVQAVAEVDLDGE